jgi:hypothetical protein
MEGDTVRLNEKLHVFFAICGTLIVMAAILSIWESGGTITSQMVFLFVIANCVLMCAVKK